MQAVAARFPGLSLHVDHRRGSKQWTVRFWRSRSDVVYPAVHVAPRTDVETIVARVQEVLDAGPRQ